jgi:hypothetical protein
MIDLALLVTGSRDWNDQVLMSIVLTGVVAFNHAHTVALFEGEAAGADTMARNWAETRMSLHGVEVEAIPFPADWDVHGKAAGPIRNQLMVDAFLASRTKSKVAVAFKDRFDWELRSGGTEDCVRRLVEHNVHPWIIGHSTGKPDNAIQLF